MEKTASTICAATISESDIQRKVYASQESSGKRFDVHGMLAY